MRSRPHTLVLLLALLLGLPVLGAEPGPASPQVGAAVEGWVAQRKVKDRVTEALARFYAARGHQPAWFLEGVALEQARAYLAALEEAEREGLSPERYGRSALQEGLLRVATAGAPEDAWLEVELRLTESFLTYASHLHFGQVSPEHFGWRVEKPEVDLAALLEQALANVDVGGVLRGLAPPHEGYQRLKDSLAHHRVLAAEGGWPQVPPGPPLKPGMRDARVAVVRERLRVTGELKEAAPSVVEQLVASVLATGVRPPLEGEAVRATGLEPPAVLPVVPDAQLFDEALEEAVKAFQRAHGLEPDGQVGGRTLAALRVPVEARIQQLLVNLERWRWLPADLGARHVRVNLPAFELEAVEGGAPVLRTRVIIGLEDWRTPVFSDEMEHLVFNPSWHVPRRITQEEVLPKLQEDPLAAAKMGLRVSRRDTGEAVDPRSVDWSQGGAGYRFHQAPGGANPLGPVKFMFPNRYSIYLHGTPNPRLFELTSRALSHGCVRVEQPLALARFLLAGQPEWDEATLAEAVELGKERRVDLPEPVPVHLLYLTAFVDDEGRVNFRPDLYRHDAPLKRALLGLKERAGRG